MSFPGGTSPPPKRKKKTGGVSSEEKGQKGGGGRRVERSGCGKKRIGEGEKLKLNRECVIWGKMDNNGNMKAPKGCPGRGGTDEVYPSNGLLEKWRPNLR